MQKNNSTGRRRVRRTLAKTLLIMKFTAILLLVVLTQAQAKTYSQTVTIAGKNAPLGSMLREIRRQTGYTFFFDESWLKKAEKVTVTLFKAPLKQALDACFEGQPLTYVIIDNTVVIRPKAMTPDTPPPPVVMQKIGGRVTDKTGNPLPGASIKVKGSEVGTIAGPDGVFSLNVPDGAILEVSFIGYDTRTIPVTGQKTVRIILQESGKGLNDVVVVGYGTQKKVSLTSAVTTVAGEDMNRRPTTNLAQAMQGQTPGVTILDAGGVPGVGTVSINIRGIGTLDAQSGATQPLILVDGIEQRMSDLNPSDIQSISILKDASSTAIYGSRASNGVILITTKGAKSGPPSVSLDSYYGLQRAVNQPVPMDPRSYMELENTAYLNANQASKYTEPYINNYLDSMKTDPLRFPTPVNNWAKIIFHAAPQYSTAVAVTGGNEFVKTRLSMRYQDQAGIADNYFSKVREVRLSNSFKLFPKVNITTDIDYRYTYYYTPVSSYNVVYYMLHGSLWTVPQYPDGTYGVSPQGASPLVSDKLAGLSKNTGNLLVGNVRGEWEILKGLKFTTQLGITDNLTGSSNFANSYTIHNYFNPTQALSTVTPNSLSEYRNTNLEYTWNDLLTYGLTKGDHSLNLLAGYSQIGQSTSGIQAYRQGFYSNNLQTLGTGTNDATQTNNGDDATYGLRSFFGRLNYNYKGKYLFEANARYDGSSNFSTTHQYAFFPSFSGGWRVSQEKFWDKLKPAVGEFKIRGSWGKTGNQAIPQYQFYPALSQTNYSFGGTFAPGYIQNTTTDANLTWETTTQTDVGADLQLLHNQLSITADYYKKHSTGILLVLPIPGDIGENATYQNAGVVDNEGWEVSATWSNNIGKLKYSIGANFNINRNRVVSLAGTGPYINGSGSTSDDLQYIIKQGLPVDAHWGYKTAGLFQTAQEISSYPTLTTNTQPGDVKYLDANKDGKIDANDMGYLGNTFPIRTYGGTIDLQYKGFDLNLLFQGAAGFKTRIAGALIEQGDNEGFADKIFTNNYWTPQNTNARFPRPIKGNLKNVYVNDRALVNGDYLRLKNAQLSYSLPVSFATRMHLHSISVYVSGTNLITISKLYRQWHLDPEQPEVPLTQNTGDYVGGRAIYYPQVSITTFGLKVQF
ncbi:MAG TPA: TonB-dependent receptor [Puia sp.]|jgi:TonB-linked SusC/RagA family outer membrane protein